MSASTQFRAPSDEEALEVARTDPIGRILVSNRHRPASARLQATLTDVYRAGGTSMGASRLSIRIPVKPSREYIASDLDLMPEVAYQIGSLAVVREDSGDGLAVFRHDQAIGVKLVQQRQTLFPELRGSDPLHHRLPQWRYII